MPAGLVIGPNAARDEDCRIFTVSFASRSATLAASFNFPETMP